jgi:hypothetical protein
MGVPAVQRREDWGSCFPTLRQKEEKSARMGHGGFKVQTQQRIIKTSQEML